MNGFCIRDWAPEYEKMDKGVNLTEDEFTTVKSI